MGLFDIKKAAKGISKVAQAAAGEVAKSVQNIDYDKLAEDVAKQTSNAINTVKNIDAKEVVKSGNKVVSGMAETIRTTKPEDIKSGLSDMAQKSGQAINRFMNDSSQTNKDVKRVLSETEENAEVSLEEALKVMYLLANIDQDYSIEEEEMFEDILIDSDVSKETRRTIIRTGKSIVKEALEDDYEDVLKEEAIAILKADNPSEQTINKKRFIWNLLTLAKCDGDYSREEERFIRAIMRVLNVDKAILSEMESAYDTMIVLENTKTKDFEFAKQIKYRKKVIKQSIYQLIDDKEV